MGDTRLDKCTHYRKGMRSFLFNRNSYLDFFFTLVSLSLSSRLLRGIFSQYFSLSRCFHSCVASLPIFVHYHSLLTQKCIQPCSCPCFDHTYYTSFFFFFHHIPWFNYLFFPCVLLHVHSQNILLKNYFTFSRLKKLIKKRTQFLSIRHLFTLLSHTSAQEHPFAPFRYFFSLFTK